MFCFVLFVSDLAFFFKNRELGECYCKGFVRGADCDKIIY